MTAAAGSTPSRPGFDRSLRDIAVLTRRNLLQTVRLPWVLLVSLTMPVVFVLMFTAVFGGAVEAALPPAAGGRYVNWLLPGLLAQFALFAGAGTAAGLADDLARAASTGSGRCRWRRWRCSPGGPARICAERC
ncbi:MAG TPA: hypothetical protein VIL37_14110 [Natronosporangium sp.]